MNFFYDIYNSFANTLSSFFYGNEESGISSGLSSEEEGSSFLVKNKISETKDNSCSSVKCTYVMNPVKKIIEFNNEDEEYDREESEYQPDSKKVYPYFSNNDEIVIRLPMSTEDTDTLNNSIDIKDSNQYSENYIQKLIEQKNSNQFNTPEHSPIKNSTENQNEEEYPSSEVL